jgi:hypothetical protein
LHQPISHTLLVGYSSRIESERKKRKERSCDSLGNNPKMGKNDIKTGFVASSLIFVLIFALFAFGDVVNAAPTAPTIS